jgi:hypothetical protein
LAASKLARRLRGFFGDSLPASFRQPSADDRHQGGLLIRGQSLNRVEQLIKGSER